MAKDRKRGTSSESANVNGHGAEAATDVKERRKRTVTGYSIQLISSDGRICGSFTVNGKPSAGNVHRGLKEFLTSQELPYTVTTSISHDF